SVGQGKFSMAHGVAVDPQNGDVWIGDREQYRLVVYTKDGVFRRTIQMRNLICAIGFDRHGNLWVSSGQDGQLLKLDRDRRWKPPTWPGTSRTISIPATPALPGSRYGRR